MIAGGSEEAGKIRAQFHKEEEARNRFYITVRTAVAVLPDCFLVIHWAKRKISWLEAIIRSLIGQEIHERAVFISKRRPVSTALEVAREYSASVVNAKLVTDLIRPYGGFPERGELVRLLGEGAPDGEKWSRWLEFTSAVLPGWSARVELVD